MGSGVDNGEFYIYTRGSGNLREYYGSIHEAMGIPAPPGEKRQRKRRFGSGQTTEETATSSAKQTEARRGRSKQSKPVRTAREGKIRKSLPFVFRTLLEDSDKSFAPLGLMLAYPATERATAATPLSTFPRRQFAG